MEKNNMEKSDFKKYNQYKIKNCKNKNYKKYNIKSGSNMKYFIIGLLILIIILIIFACINYKNKNNGNIKNIKTLQDVENYILNISSYQANINVEVNSNKNKCTYELKQGYASENNYYQVGVSPDSIKGIEIKYKNNNLEVNNTKLNLKTIYENYEIIEKDILFLNTFIDEYKNNKENNNEKVSEIYEKDNCIIMKTKNEKGEIKQLYINKESILPERLIVQDMNQKVRIYIKYNEIKFNEKNNKEDNDIISFKIVEDTKEI